MDEIKTKLMDLKKNPDKDVHRYSRQFFLIGFILSTAIIITAFEWTTEKKIYVTPPPILDTDFTPLSIPVTTQEDKQNEALPNKLKQIDLIRIVENEPLEGDPKENSLLSPPDIEVYLTGLDIPKEVPQDTFIIVEKMPVPIGGYSAFYKKISTAMTYPQKARRKSTEGKVFVEFIINQIGDPINIKVIKGIGDGCDEEAIRVLSNEKWEPGKQRGNPVLVKMNMSIQFKLN